MAGSVGLAYKPGWTFKVAGPGGRFLCVFARTPDSLAPERMRVTQHQFEIPDGQDRREFARWVFDRLLEVERHEAAEFFQVDGERPFWPGHGDGDPYAATERWVS